LTNPDKNAIIAIAAKIPKTINATVETAVNKTKSFLLI